MGEVTPLFIFGMGRSGTTSALRVLNAHPQVMLNGEISLSVMKQFFDLLDGVEKSYGGKDATLDAWHTRKADYMLDSFGYLSKGGRGQLKKIPETKFRGHKSPRHETLFDRYETHFASANLQPLYFYCARNPFDCWRSYKAAAWNGYETASAFLEHYIASFAQLEHMRRRAEGRVFLLNLDSLIASPDASGWYRDKLFSPLNLDAPEKTLRRIEKFGEERGASPTPQPLSDSEKTAIRNHPGVAALIDSMFPQTLATQG
jgi:hypothetical protein